MGNPNNIVELSQISWKREGKSIIEDVSWSIRSGEHWSLVGLNGSGKTTLLNMINGYIWPTAGQISVLNQTFGTCDLRQLRKRIGRVSTSLQNRLNSQEYAERIVMSGKHASIGLYEPIQDSDQVRAQELMEELGCAHLIGRAYGTLSQGERQRILIARAWMASPELLILDEACTGLDLLAREQVLAMIEQIARSEQAPTLIYVTHHIEEIMPCFTHSLLLRSGRVFAQGESSQMLTTENLSGFFQTPIQVQSGKGRMWISLTESVSESY